MAVRGSRDLQIDTQLTNISIAYQNLSYIADMLFPIVEVRKQSAQIVSFARSHWYRDEAKPRAPGTGSEGVSWEPGDPLTYFAKRYSYRDEIADEDRDNADSIWQLEETSTEFVTDKIQMRRERNFAAAYFKTGVWGVDEEGGVSGNTFDPWDDYGTSSPLTDMTRWIDAGEFSIGREANVMVLGKQVWNVIRWHPDLIELIKYTRTGVLNETLIAELLGIPRIVIGRSIYTTDPEGTAEDDVTYQRVWGKHGLLLYVPASPSLRTPAAGYTFVWNRVPNAIQWIKRMRDEEKEIDIIESNTYFDQKVTSPMAGTFLSNMVA